MKYFIWSIALSLLIFVNTTLAKSAMLMSGL